MTRLLPLYVAVLTFAITPFVLFSMVPVWVGYLALIGLLLCLALETWQTALTSLLQPALPSSRGPDKPDLRAGEEAEPVRKESQEAAPADDLDGAVEAALNLLRFPRQEVD